MSDSSCKIHPYILQEFPCSVCQGDLVEAQERARRSGRPLDLTGIAASAMRDCLEGRHLFVKMEGVTLEDGVYREWPRCACGDKQEFTETEISNALLDQAMDNHDGVKKRVMSSPTEILAVIESGQMPAGEPGSDFEGDVNTSEEAVEIMRKMQVEDPYQFRLIRWRKWLGLSGRRKGQ